MGSAWLALVVVSGASSTPPRAGDEPAPYRVALRAAYGEPLGPEEVRRELEAELTARLRNAECFLQVEPVDGAEQARSHDLLAEVVLDEYEEETLYGGTIAQHNDPDAEPDVARRYTSSVEARVYLQVRRGADGTLVRMKRYRQRVERRPVLDEDARLEARFEMIDEVARRARSYFCDPSHAKWEKLIREAR